MYKKLGLFALMIAIYHYGIAQVSDKKIRQAEKKLFTEQFDLAYNDYKKISEEFPEEKRIDYHKEVAYLMSKGRGQSLDKIVAYEKIKGDNDRIYYYWLGRIYFENYEFEKSINAFDNFLSKDGFKSESLIEDAKVFKSWANDAKKYYDQPNDYEIVPLPSNVNTAYADMSPSFFGDNDELLFMSSTNSKENGPNATYQVYHATRLDEITWKNPTPISSFGSFNLNNAKIEVVNRDGRAFVYRDGNMYFSEPGGSGWSTLKKFDSKINKDLIESHFFINDNEDVILFSSDVEGEGVNIFESRKNSTTGEWSDPVILPSPINSDYFEDSPYLSHDGKYLYFSSNRPGGIGGYDIYRSAYDEQTMSWGAPENMGYPINTIDDEIHFQVNEDNLSGYFSSNRLHSQGDYDLYFFKKETMIPVSGTITDNKGNRLSNHKIWFRPAKYTDEAFTASTDDQGRYTATIFQGEPFIVEIEFNDVKVHSTEFNSEPKPGQNNLKKDFAFEIPQHHPSYEDLIVSEDNEDLEMQEEELQSLDLIGSKYRSAASININNIYFDFSSAVIQEESEPVIEKILTMLKEFPTISIKIAGHTDNVGSENFNLELSKERAVALKERLVQEGIEDTRINTIGFGESKPIASNEVEKDGRALNRRIEITIID